MARLEEYPPEETCLIIYIQESLRTDPASVSIAEDGRQYREIWNEIERLERNIQLDVAERPIRLCELLREISSPSFAICNGMRSKGVITFCTPIYLNFRGGRSDVDGVRWNHRDDLITLSSYHIWPT
jgi:hypothetical protein